VDKGPYLKAVKELALKQGYDVEVFNVGAMMYKDAAVELQTVFGDSSYATQNGTATALADYAPVSGTLAFADGETQKTIAIPIIIRLKVERLKH